MSEKIVVWRDSLGGKPVLLEMWDTGRTKSHNGASILRYSLSHNEVEIFEGDDFAGSPLHSIDSAETVAALLSFLSLRPGDTDKEYFDDYSPAQLEFADHFGEELSMLSIEMEESGDFVNLLDGDVAPF